MQEGLVSERCVHMARFHQMPSKLLSVRSVHIYQEVCLTATYVHDGIFALGASWGFLGQLYKRKRMSWNLGEVCKLLLLISCDSFSVSIIPEFQSTLLDKMML